MRGPNWFNTTGDKKFELAALTGRGYLKYNSRFVNRK